MRWLADMPAHRQDRPLSAAEGIRDAAINEISPQLARTIAAEFARRLISQRETERPTVVFAGDGRLATAAIVGAIVEGIRWTRCETVDLGAASAPCMARAMKHIAADGGIYLGNRGGAAHTLGMKFWRRGEPLSQDEFLDSLAVAVLQRTHHAPRDEWHRAERDEYETLLDRPTRTFGPLRRIDAAEIYLNDLRPAYHALRPLRFLLQCHCGPVVSYLEDLLRNVACRVIPAEPGKGDFAVQIVAAKAHFGMQITDDGEHCRVFDEQGQPVTAERLARVLANAAGQVRADDALRTLTMLLVLLSRDDRSLSAVLDREAPAE
jgi:phosphomannomutase